MHFENEATRAFQTRKDTLDGQKIGTPAHREVRADLEKRGQRKKFFERFGSGATYIEAAKGLTWRNFINEWSQLSVERAVSRYIRIYITGLV